MMLVRALVLTPMLVLAACGGNSDTGPAATSNDIAAKANADVDAAMADAQRSRVAPPATAAPARQ